MKDAELVLRFFALKDIYEKYGGGLKGILDNYLDVNQNIGEKIVNKLEYDFLKTLELVQIIFGYDGAFRRWIHQSNKWKQQISAPLYDAQMLSLYGKNPELILKHKNEILTDFKLLFFEDKTFIESIESSTAAPNRFHYRIDSFTGIINKYS